MAVGSFSAGLSGLNANGQALSVIGNNLANINTVGFKASTVSFTDLVSQTVGGSSTNVMQIGLGVATGSISPVFSQGAIENTQESTNVAIQGGGLFVLRDEDGFSYTRAGNFSFDASGNLVSADGLKVQGYTAIDPVTGKVITSGQPTDITVPPGVLRAPKPTTSFSMQTNLNANAPEGTVFTSPVQIYDALGTPHVATITYTKTDEAGVWDYEVTVPDTEAEGDAGAVDGTISLGTGSLEFDGDGKLTDPEEDVVLAAPDAWLNGATATDVTWRLFDTNSVATITSYSSESATSSVTQNGSAPGKITSVSIAPDGTIVATFGAGRTLPVAQLSLASFNNPKGLTKLGNNRYGESESAGTPNVGTAGTGGRGTLIGSAIERSNVDIAQEFTQMILAQRGYQANSKTITVSDELLVDTLQLKR
jgi:flagellar hook protein FlgE